MTIRRGADWGGPVPADPDAPSARSDAELVELAAPAIDWDRMRVDGPVGRVRLLGGDLHRTLGSPRQDASASADLVAVTCDLVLVQGVSDAGQPLNAIAAAHVVGVTSTRWRERPPLWSTPSVVAMNAAFAGPANLGPRAHPGDGLLDVTSGTLSRRDRRRATRRARTGTHLPHPSLSERRTPEWAAPEGVRYVLTIDGVGVGGVRNLRLVVAPEAVVVLL